MEFFFPNATLTSWTFLDRFCHHFWVVLLLLCCCTHLKVMSKMANKCSTGQICIRKDITSYKIGTLQKGYLLSNNCDLGVTLNWLCLMIFFINPFEIEEFLCNINLIKSNILFTNWKPETSILNRVFSLCRLCIWMTLLKGSKVHLQSYKMSASTNRPKTQGNHVCWSWYFCLLSSVPL